MDTLSLGSQDSAPDAPLLTGSNDGGKKSSQDGYGGKSIGFFASMCLLCNNICSAGMVQIPTVFQAAGWLYPTLIFMMTSLVACLASLLLCKAVAWISGNRNYEKRVEFSGFARSLFPRWLYLVTVGVLIFSFMSNNVSAIVVSAQVMDSTLIAMFHKTCAMIIYNSGNNTKLHGVFDCISELDGSLSDSPFGDAYVISIGFLIVMAAVVPLGYLNLDDNMWVQVGGMALLSACVFVWMGQFMEMGLDAVRMPAVSTSGYDIVLSSIIFNYGYVATIPSWLNEKGPGVGVVWSNIIAVVFATALYFILGVFGGLALPVGTQDVLTAIDQDSSTWIVSKIATYIFPIANLMSSIPVFAILIRYNLLNSGICGKTFANVFAVLLPWILALFFYAGSQLTQLMNWSSAIFFVLLNLVIPIYMFVVQYKRVKRHGDENGYVWDESSGLFGRSAGNSSSLRPSSSNVQRGSSPVELSRSTSFCNPAGTGEDEDDALLNPEETVTQDVEELLPDPMAEFQRDPFYVLPEWVRENVISEIGLAYFLVFFTVLVAGATFAEQVQTTN